MTSSRLFVVLLAGACSGEGSAGTDGTSGETAADDATAASTSSTTGGTTTSSGTGEGGSAQESGGGTGGCEIDLPPQRCLSRAPDDPNDDETREPMRGFIVEPDGGVSMPCDVYEQGCPRGQKCMPIANDGGPGWNDTACRPIAPQPKDVGEPCTAEGGPTSGYDDCALGLMCWSVDPDTNMGECIELCSCTSAQPVCNTPDTFCSVGNNGVVPVCISPCNPLDIGVCGAGKLCAPNEGWFICAPDGSGDGGLAGEPCQFINTCAPGHVCGEAGSVPGCAGEVGCCTALCTVGDDAPCLPGQTCVPWFERGAAPDACLGSVGACSANR